MKKKNLEASIYAKRERKRRKRKWKGKIGDGKNDIVDVVQKKIQGRNKNTLSKPLTKKICKEAVDRKGKASFEFFSTFEFFYFLNFNEFI